MEREEKRSHTERLSSPFLIYFNTKINFLLDFILLIKLEMEELSY